MLDIREKLKQYRRVLIVSRKPTKDEFVNVSKICAAGMAFIGGIGFLIFLIFLFSGL